MMLRRKKVRRRRMTRAMMLGKMRWRMVMLGMMMSRERKR